MQKTTTGRRPLILPNNDHRPATGLAFFAGDGDEEMVKKSVMLKRLSEKDTRIEALTADVATYKAASESVDADGLQAEVGRLQSRLDKAQTRIETTEAEFSSYKANSTTEKAMMAAGVTDPEDMDLVRYRYGKLDEKSRPDLADWLSDGAKKDRHLSSMFSGGGDTDTDTGDGGQDNETESNTQRRTSARSTGVSPTNPRAGGGGSVEAFLAKPVADRISPEGRKEWASLMADGS
jgi:hypothetical protein